MHGAKTMKVDEERDAVKERAKVWMLGDADVQRTRESVFDNMADFAIQECAALRTEINRYKIALADAIRSPMGVYSDSAAGLLTQEEIDDVERRRSDAAARERQSEPLTRAKLARMKPSEIADLDWAEIRRALAQ